MAKKKRVCIREGCTYPALKSIRRCGWHYIDEEPMEKQERAAELRLAKATEERSRVPAKEWPAGVRFCGGCRSYVPLFYVRGSRCKACASKGSHRAAIEKKYDWPAGMTYERLLAIQGGRCAICRRLPRTRRLATDHDHDSGVVRGLLCAGERGCNHGLLGSANDDVTILRNAVHYLESPPAQTR